MQINPLAAGFGAEIRGATLKQVAADDSLYRDVRAAFEEHSVLVFRAQEIDNDAQLAFTRRFGEPEVVPVGTAGMGGHFITLSNFGKDGKVVPGSSLRAAQQGEPALAHRLVLQDEAGA